MGFKVQVGGMFFPNPVSTCHRGTYYNLIKKKLSEILALLAIRLMSSASSAAFPFSQSMTPTNAHQSGTYMQRLQLSFMSYKCGPGGGGGSYRGTDPGGGGGRGGGGGQAWATSIDINGLTDCFYYLSDKCTKVRAGRSID